ncbi:phosphotransferase [Azoarcus sp. TTM-91]|uniref:lipopolysaccharide kinase InaA family protein n=1 Tax=Azoarcus sp. TTM-91 TaxID=2691581 RepID=UPI00145CEA71|nr:lipopolysaccharide kinase InaA family protein [Azoarcus sp. TTM-91]NMG33601.1 phosphotransferase [Azoarcus sp. TTM-91]
MAAHILSAGAPAQASDSADAFAHWWTFPGEWVEPVNRRRAGWSGVLRATQGDRVLYIKRQCGHLCRTPSRPLGWPTASREWHYLGRLAALGIPTPQPLFHGSRRGEQGQETVLVTAELQGYRPLAEQTALSPEQRRQLAAEVGKTLGRLHRARLQHGCLYDKHIMVRWRDGQADVALLDLEKMRPRLRRSLAAGHDLEQLSRHQTLWQASDWQHLLAAHARHLNLR